MYARHVCDVSRKDSTFSGLAVDHVVDYAHIATWSTSTQNTFAHVITKRGVTWRKDVGGGPETEVQQTVALRV